MIEESLQLYGQFCHNNYINFSSIAIPNYYKNNHLNKQNERNVDKS